MWKPRLASLASLATPSAQPFSRRFCTPSVAGAAASSGWNGLVFSFGKKHYGRPLSQVVAEDPAYCRRILRRAEGANVPAGLQQLAELLRLTAPHLQENGGQAEASASSSGKHLVQDVGEVADKHKEKCLPAETAGERGRWQHARDLSVMVEEDPVYCQWLLREAKESHASPRMREHANWLLENAPHLQEQGMLVIGGKHRGRRLSELVAEDPSYCHWILREAQEPQASRGMKDMAGWLMQNAPHLQERGIFAGGTRHRGRLLSELLSDDPGYCQWVLGLAQDSSADHLREQATWLRENAPYLTEVPVISFRSIHKGIPLPQVVAEEPCYCCCWVLGRQKAVSPRLATAADWIRDNASELLEDQSDAVQTAIAQRLFERYGEHFVVRSGKYRMKTFAAVVKEAPEFVQWAVSQSASDRGATANIRFLAAFAGQLSSQETAALSSGSSKAAKKRYRKSTKSLTA